MGQNDEIKLAANFSLVWFHFCIFVIDTKCRSGSHWYIFCSPAHADDSAVPDYIIG